VNRLPAVIFGGKRRRREPHLEVVEMAA